VAKLTDDEIRARLDAEIRQSVGYNSGELSSQREKALNYYHGEPFGNELEGRSSYVSRDVADTIEWIMPSLMRIFTGGDDIVRFEPQGPEDEKAAKQATDYINYVFQRQNDGFLTLYTWFKDALLSKNGFVKVYWEKYSESKTETYESLTDDEFVQIVQDPSVEVLEHTEESVMGGMVPMTTHSVKIRKKKDFGKCCVVPVPPEEVLVNRYPTYPLHSNRFIAHRRRITLSELKEMGYEDVEDITSYEDDDNNIERVARYAFDETDQMGEETPSDPSMKYVWLAECYMKLDVDGDGVAELRKITMAGNKILDNEECESCPFVTITPIILPHKLFGMSVADLIMDLQLLKSTVFRQILDNMYLANNGRYMALDGMVNIDDLLTSRPGGIVRVKTFDAVKPMQPPLLGAPAFNLLEYIDTIKENRTGITRYNQGIDSESLNKTATGINQIMSAAQQRTELIARVFAETGVKDLFYAILECVQKHQDKAQFVRLNGQWVPMDPREWQTKFDMAVAVGLGTGSKESVIAALGQTIQLQMAALQGGLPIATPENLYHSGMELLKAQSIKGGELFFTHPSQIPQHGGPNPEMVKIQAKAQADEHKLQLKAHDMEIKSQMREKEFQVSTRMEAARLQQEAEKAKIEALMEAERMKMEAMIEREKAQAMMQLEKEKAAIQAMLQAEKQGQEKEAQDRDREMQSEHMNADRLERVITAFQQSVEKMQPQSKKFTAKKNANGVFEGEVTSG